MTDEDIVDLGLFSRGLLSHPHFTTLAAEFERSVVQSILATKPDQAELREREYTKVTGAQAFVAFIANVAKHADDLTDPTPVEDDDVPLPDPFD